MRNLEFDDPAGTISRREINGECLLAEYRKAGTPAVQTMRVDLWKNPLAGVFDSTHLYDVFIRGC